MSDLDLVLAVCGQLHSKGTTPTSALVKFNLQKTVPFPTIISGIQYWQKLTPEQKAKYATKEDSDNATTACDFIKKSAEGQIINMSDDEFQHLEAQQQTLYLKKVLETTIFQLTKEISQLKTEKQQKNK